MYLLFIALILFVILLVYIKFTVLMPTKLLVYACMIIVDMSVILNYQLLRVHVHVRLPIPYVLRVSNMLCDYTSSGLS